MSTHTGVSCDSCMVSNFPGRRYKCLLCDNYDLCGKCYDIEAESQNHKNNHPMQCLLTEAAAELFYAGETISRRSVVSLTCPYCAQSGFTSRTLLTHCVEKHAAQGKNTQVVMCPICITSPSHRSRSRFALLADHIATAHDEGVVTGEEDSPATPFPTQPRRTGGDEEDSDDEEVDLEDDEQLTLNDFEHRAFVEEEQRRQEATRQRLANASSFAAAIRNDYIAALTANNNNSNTQRRPLSRQTAIRVPRGNFRNHFSSFPYGSTSRSNPGTAPSSVPRNAPDASTTTTTTTTTASQNPAATDPFLTAYNNDPMLEFVSQLMNGQPSATPSTTNPASSQFLFGSFVPVQLPGSAASNPIELARIQQQIENNEAMIQIKTTLLNSKQKRSSQNQQQSSSQPVIIGHPSGHDYQLWQQHFPNLQPTMMTTNLFGNALPNDPILGNSNPIFSTLKTSSHSHQDNDPRSWLGKISRNEQNVIRDENNEVGRTQPQDHVSFLQSILISSLNASLDEEQEASQQTTTTTDKENHR